jgi:AcrR family transcriptional regulator
MKGPKSSKVKQMAANMPASADAAPPAIGPSCDAVKRGRPREFDVKKALDQALNVFWAKGYEGTTLPDLTEAMGINRPSLYAAFGNKESLFRKVLERYRQGPVAYVLEAMEAKTARAVAQKLLGGTVDALTDPDKPRGCMVVQGALAGGESAVDVRKECISLRATAQTALRERFERAKLEGDLPRDCSPADLARYIATVMHGMTIQAASGASRDELRGIVKMTMRAWPG